MDENVIRGLFAFAGALIGGAVGHWLTLDREKRKEFNEAVRPLRDRLITARDAGNWQHSFKVDAVELDRIAPYLPHAKRAALAEALATIERDVPTSAMRLYPKLGEVEQLKARVTAAYLVALRITRPR